MGASATGKGGFQKRPEASLLVEMAPVPGHRPGAGDGTAGDASHHTRPCACDVPHLVLGVPQGTVGGRIAFPIPGYLEVTQYPLNKDLFCWNEPELVTIVCNLEPSMCVCAHVYAYMAVV